ncbi:MAG: hypothetical protein DBY04_03600 [Clostridiales bacterium]|nr:MAG: hypothetical protein DBY04_03600 [Clostridiales bacterium]
MYGEKTSRLNYIWKFGKRYLIAFLIAEICILVSYAVSVFLPLNLTRLTDDVLYGSNYSLLPIVIRDYCILFIISTAFNFIYAFVWQYLNNHYILDIKNEMFKSVIYSKASYLSRMNSGDLMTRIDYDSEQFIHVVQRNLFHFINSVFMCAGIIIVVAQINGFIAALLVIAAILPIVFTRIGGRFTEKYSRASRELSGELTGRLYEVLKGIREIKILNAFSWAEKKIIAPIQKLLLLGNKTRGVSFTVNKYIELINILSTISIYGVSVFFVLRDSLSVGLFLAVIQYVSLLHRKFNWILRIWQDWYIRKVSIDRVTEILELEQDVSGHVEVKRINTVEFKNVGFEYEKGSPVLKDFNMLINFGEKVGIVGQSGNGKTTVTSLLLGLYPVNSGDILINGIPLPQINQAQLRKRLGVVSQDVMIFEDTIRYNLNLGEEYSDEDIYSALQAVELLEIVNTLPKKVDTVISATSHNLSGGQKQRLMIARMLLRKPEFIIMDEATSALDVETEKVVLQAIKTILGKATVLVVSHRFESIRDCDKIVVINNYTAEAVGTHESLIRKSPTYMVLFGR